MEGGVRGAEPPQTNDITIFGSVFPRSKGYDDERVSRDEVVFFIFAGKFAANMAVKCM